MNPFTPERKYIEELLDLGEGTEEDVARSLSDLRAINRFLGGTSVVLEALSHCAEGRISLLDVGTGSADIPGAVLEWCGARGIEARVAAVDISERHLRIARDRLGIRAGVDLVRADAFSLPFPPESFDYVTASLFLHHFREEDATRLVRGFSRVARRAVIVNDLVRSLVPYYFIRVAGPVFGASYLTRHDGPASVLRGFTTSEMRRIAEGAGLARFTIRRRFPYRLSLIGH